MFSPHLSNHHFLPILLLAKKYRKNSLSCLQPSCLYTGFLDRIPPSPLTAYFKPLFSHPNLLSTAVSPPPPQRHSNTTPSQHIRTWLLFLIFYRFTVVFCHVKALVNVAWYGFDFSSQLLLNTFQVESIIIGDQVDGQAKMSKATSRKKLRLSHRRSTEKILQCC